MNFRRTTLVLGALTAFSQAALAADLPPRVAPIYKSPAVVAYNWTGFYIGAHVGYGWETLTGTDLVFGTTSDVKLNGFLAGGQIGYNYQMGSWVFGIEGDASWSNAKFTVSDPLGVGVGEAKLTNDYFATIAGRIGYAFDNWLPYFKGGGAFTRDKFDINDGIGGTATGTFNRTGWTVGAGLEYGFAGNWSAKIEYNYMDFGAINETLTTTGGLAATPANVSAKVNILKGGVNYRF